MMTSKVKISITRGKLAGKSFSIKKPGFISIGGAKECHITLPDDEMVADRHCLLIIRPDEVRLRDLGSVHGTYVNGRVFGAGAEGLTDESGAPQTQEIRLKNNDRLTIGSTEIVIRILKPNSCKRCGYEMSPEELQQARRAGPGPLCASCRHVLQAARARAARAAGGGGGSEAAEAAPAAPPVRIRSAYQPSKWIEKGIPEPPKPPPPPEEMAAFIRAGGGAVEGNGARRGFFGRIFGRLFGRGRGKGSAAARRAPVGEGTGAGRMAPGRVALGPPPEPGGPIHCLDCGQEVTDEAGQDWLGPYMCHVCRRVISAEVVGTFAHIESGEKRESTLVEEYDLIRKLDAEGFTRIYQAIDRRNGNSVTVKAVIRGEAMDEAQRKRLMRQLQTMKMLKHPHVVQLTGYGAAGDVLFFITEFCDCGSFEDLVKARGGSVDLEEVLPWMEDALRGLAAAHRRKIVHRDIKPQHILLQRTRTRVVAKISDFGLAKQFQGSKMASVTMMGTRIGAPRFMPREQALDFKNVKPSTDIWSMAATFYYVLTGEPPRPVPTDGDAIGMVLEGKSVKIRRHSREIPRKLARIIDRALSIEPRKRYQDADAMLNALIEAQQK